MDKMEHMEELLEGVTLDDLLASPDAEFLDECRMYYEEIEEYEICAFLRDRIKILKDVKIDILRLP